MTQPSNGNGSVITREPVITTVTATALIIALCALLRAFGVPITGDEQDAITGFVGAAGVIVAGFISRGYVTPLSSPRNASGQRLVVSGSVAGGGTIGGRPGGLR
jgi:hypothetical protein